MTESQTKEFIDSKKDQYIKCGHNEKEAEEIAYADLEEYLTRNNFILEY